MDRLSYFIRRLLLVIPTFIGITLICFTLCQFLPGGPVEQAVLRMRGGGEGAQTGMASESISQAQRKAIEKQFGYDQPILMRYWTWLTNGFMGMNNTSFNYNNKTAWQLIKERFPISLTFGLIGFMLSYLVCIPLGIVKALRDGSGFDFASSILVFVGYAIPPFAFGMLLIMLFCGTHENFFDIFPLSGFRSENFADLALLDKMKDLFMHMFLPLLCYVIGNFAVLTLLMKNSLLEQISQDYIRTVIAKGGTLKRAIWCHALRNAMIPIATGLGSIFTLIFASSVVIEKVFGIHGMGLLSLEAIVSRDYMVFMGILSLSSILGLLGRIFSDLCYLLIDPRINFNKE